MDEARGWQRESLTGLAVPQPDYIGGFRGEAGAPARCEVRIGDAHGVPAAAVANELQSFQIRLLPVMDMLDEAYPIGTDLDADGLAAVLDLAAWAHAEWVRIHPCANGNGRTARFFANSILMCYGIPPIVTLRPRPESGYAEAAKAAMNGDWKPTATVFREMLLSALSTTTQPKR